MNNLREKIYNLCVENGYSVGNYVSKNAMVYSAIGEGTLGFPGTMIGTDVKMGKCNIFEPCVCMGHDNVIGDYNFFAGGSCFGGYVEIGNHCFVGMNSTVMNDVKVNDYILIGQSSNVINSITSCWGGVFVGNPARQLANKQSIQTKI